MAQAFAYKCEVTEIHEQVTDFRFVENNFYAESFAMVAWA